MKEEDQILIAKKLRGELLAEEKDTFQQRLATDIEFQKNYHFEKHLIENLNEEDWDMSEDFNQSEIEAYTELYRSRETQELKETLSRVKTRFRSKEVTPLRRQKWLWFAAAAAIALLIITSLLINSQKTPKGLYISYFDVNEIPSLNQRSAEENLTLSEAQQFFKKGAYEEALSLFKQLEVSGEINRANLLLYIGVSEMELEKFNEAEETFNTLINSNLMDASKGYWFKALLYLKMGESEKAKEILEKIKVNSLYNYQKTDEILNSLD